jgi:hypothetical protein
MGQQPLSPVVGHLRIDHVMTHHIGPPGLADQSHDGCGIVIFMVDDGIIHHCQAFDNGAVNEPLDNGKPQSANDGVGFATFFSNHILLEYNDAHDNRTKYGDQGGFDFDRFTTNSIMQFNYSHHNDGWGFMIGSVGVMGNRNGMGDQLLPPENNVIRFNISTNDCRNSAAGAMLFENWLGSDVYVYNNTFYMSKNEFVGGTAPAINCGSDAGQNESPPAPLLRIYNNLLLSDSDEVPLVSVPSNFPLTNLRFQRNDYYSKGKLVSIIWQGSPITLDDFRSRIGQERLGSMVASADPRLGFNPLMPPGIPNIDQMDSALMAGFELTSSNTPTVIQTGGVDLARVVGPLTNSGNWWAPDPFWMSMGVLGTKGHDLWGTDVPKPIGAGLYSIGASQYKPIP